jgi:hypothetical protein
MPPKNNASTSAAIDDPIGSQRPVCKRGSI